MKTDKTIINIILDKLRRNAMLSDIPFETVVDYTVDFMTLVGFPSFFAEKVVTLTVNNYKALLPIDCSEVKAVRGTIVDSNDLHPIAFRKATDTFATSKNKKYANDYTYKIVGHVIYTSLESGKIEIVYSAFETDINGFPLIPNNNRFFIALENYIKVKHFTKLFEEGKLQPVVLEHAEREYYWSVGSCESEFHKLSMDEAESIGNQWRQILINTNEHFTSYANLGVKKDLKIK